ncbi:MAG: shikimate kinase [Spirochaetaceae bacterium]|jgi:shikimate kinase|nr:shikimate kinase [Spirochaetaceae bacterium]
MKAVFLTGIKHCGKTTLGKLLAERLGAEFIDTDDVITAQTGMSPREVFLSQGNTGFQAAEYRACLAVAERAAAQKSPLVAATGGGICDNPPALDALRGQGVFVFLDVNEARILARVLKKAVPLPDGTLGNLPAYIAREKPRTPEDVGRVFHPVFAAREAKYRALADVVFSPGDCPPEHNAGELAGALAAGAT